MLIFGLPHIGSGWVSDAFATTQLQLSSHRQLLMAADTSVIMRAPDAVEANTLRGYF